jgi:gamma-glutamylcyclotransferase (GGCT)/AIG2-like uncharacterized protein YtfP
MKQNLFVYGTLHPDHAPKEIRSVVKKMVPVGSGTIAGNLHHLGDYPALTLDGKKKQRVKGTVFALPDDPETLQKIDQYEEYLPNDPSNSLFIRSKRLVTLGDGTRRLCWVYIYNQPIRSCATSPPATAGKT